MKHGKLTYVYLSALLVMGYFFLSSNSAGVYGKSTAGCGGASCHQDSPNTLINLTGVPITGYVNGSSYTMTLTVSNPTKTKAGFNLTTNMGSLAPGLDMSLNGTQELKHSQPVQMISNVATWTFTWTAPPTGVSPVIFFIAGNAVDGNANSSNDEFETTQAQFDAASSTSAPSITNVSGNGTSSSTASVSANINAHGDPASVSVEYGLTTTYGSSISTTPSVVNGTTFTPVSAAITGLQPATMYHYRVIATNLLGTTQGADGVFTTMPTSMNTIEQSSIQLFPNPTQDVLRYQDEENKSNVVFEVYDFLGKSCNVKTMKQDLGNYTLDLMGLAAGNYLLLIRREGKLFCYPFAKQ